MSCRTADGIGPCWLEKYRSPVRRAIIDQWILGEWIVERNTFPGPIGVAVDTIRVRHRIASRLSEKPHHSSACPGHRTHAITPKLPQFFPSLVACEGF